MVLPRTLFLSRGIPYVVHHTFVRVDTSIAPHHKQHRIRLMTRGIWPGPMSSSAGDGEYAPTQEKLSEANPPYACIFNISIVLEGMFGILHTLRPEASADDGKRAASVLEVDGSPLRANEGGS